MKKNDSVSISASGRGTNGAGGAAVSAVFLVLITLMAAALFPAGGNLGSRTIKEVYFKLPDGRGSGDGKNYERLLAFKKGDSFNYKKIRLSMENLSKTGLFSDIQVDVETEGDGELNVHFLLTRKYRIRTLKIMPVAGVKNRYIREAIFSLQKRTLLKMGNVTRALKQIRTFMESRGYFNAGITHKIIKNDPLAYADVYFFIKPGKKTKIDGILIDLPELPQLLKSRIKTHFARTRYIPYLFQKEMEKVKDLLKKEKYYFPEIKIEEKFKGDSKETVALTILVRPGYKYEFKFNGVKSKIDLIASVWETKVFEKWAEQESKARILYHMKNKGYLNAEVKSTIRMKRFTKYVTFDVDKKEKYKLGHIAFKGNKSFPESRLREIIHIDDLVFETYFHVRVRSLRVDLGVLRLFYYFNGFPTATVSMVPTFRKKRVDISFVIDEGPKYTVDTVLFSGNREVATETLASVIHTKENGPFVQQKLNEDLEKLKNYYYSEGFDKVEITPEISPGVMKSILLRIDEGPRFRLGNLIIIGASTVQEILLKKLFPFKEGGFYDRQKIEAFRSQVENSAIFNEIKIVNLTKSVDTIDILVKVTPDKSFYYGFGVGAEQRKGVRGTLEYQQRNVFNGYSSLSSILQLGKNERRGIISYDTPYFFQKRINSEFRVWLDDEIYPSYHFERGGFRESLIKKLSDHAYILGSLGWARTKLTSLEINPNDVDLLDVPFDTTSLRLSYVMEKRDNPFNPTTGDFFSSDIKLGTFRYRRNGTADRLISGGYLDEGIFGKNFNYLKLRFSYQKNFRFLKNGSLAFTVKNGWAFGDLTINERFFAGGVNSFRGTKTDRLGPHDNVLASTGDSNDPLAQYYVGDPSGALGQNADISREPRGGNALLLMNLEATFPIPIIPGEDFYYSFFLDVGNVFDRSRDFRFKDLEKAVGFSFKIKTELGPLRFDFAWKLGRREIYNGKKEDGFVWHVGFGNVL